MQTLKLISEVEQLLSRGAEYFVATDEKGRFRAYLSHAGQKYVSTPLRLNEAKSRLQVKGWSEHVVPEQPIYGWCDKQMLPPAEV